MLFQLIYLGKVIYLLLSKTLPTCKMVQVVVLIRRSDFLEHRLNLKFAMSLFHWNHCHSSPKRSLMQALKTAYDSRWTGVPWFSTASVVPRPYVERSSSGESWGGRQGGGPPCIKIGYSEPTRAESREGISTRAESSRVT